MTYPFQTYQQPFQYQDQLNQLRNTPMAVPGQFQMPQYGRQDPSGLNWVQGEAGAKSWFVAPGATVLLMDSEAQRFYLKSADMNGVPAMRTFEYAEVSAERPATPQEPAKYVTVDEFTQFKNDVMSKLDAPVEVSLSRKKKGADDE